VELVKATAKTVAEVAPDLKINDTTLGKWVKAAPPDLADPPLRPAACGR
jgi:transposase-like protein